MNKTNSWDSLYGISPTTGSLSRRDETEEEKLLRRTEVKLGADGFALVEVYLEELNERILRELAGDRE